MKKLLLALLFFTLPFLKAFPVFHTVENIDDVYIKRVAISSFDADILYVGSKNSLFISPDSGKTFQKISVFKDEELAHFFIDPYLANTLYLATTRHLYKVTNEAEKIFNAPEEAVVLTAAKFKNEIYVGTSNGLYVANEDVLNWRKVNGLNEEVSVYSIESAEKNLYLATSKGVYILRNKDEIERTYVLRDKEVEGEEESGITPNIIKVDIFNKNCIWLGTSRGVIFSKDAGRTWDRLYIEGVDNLNVCSIAQTPLEKDTLYLGTSKGFFKVDLRAKRSTQIFEGLFASEILWVTFSASGEIYLATPQGLFRSEYFTPPSKPSMVEEVLNKEPSIDEIQQVALRYNETHPEKIRRWRNLIKFRALFPTLTLDYDKTIDIYQTTTTTRAVTGPRDWGLSLSWNVGDLVWNTYEDDIDTRSRLDTQLRLDILDEINRVYFERLRLKRELRNASLSEEELFPKDLRLRELTAIIDGYTGGYFSKKSKELNEK
ncbi:MAG: hypothetical protein Q8O30_01135 [Candidatus Omnitrophota bacterium]|nr:hypothetical protein [Candidatus Omnitrophota bacterium]